MARSKRFNAAEGLDLFTEEYSPTPSDENIVYDESMITDDTEQPGDIQAADTQQTPPIESIATVVSPASSSLFASHVFQHRERKTVQKTFKFTESVAKLLKEGAEKYDVSEAEYISALIRQGVIS